jgi:hypothetical protein
MLCRPVGVSLRLCRLRKVQSMCLLSHGCDLWPLKLLWEAFVNA